MIIKDAVSRNEFKKMDTKELRDNFLLDKLFMQDEITLVYSYVDRIIVGGVVPVAKHVELKAGDELRADFFLERREMGIINIGDSGYIVADGKRYDMDKLDCLYLGRGVKEVFFASKDAVNPACFYLNSTPAHKEYPTTHAKRAKATPVKLGTPEQCNERTIYKYIFPEGIKSCQLAMGITILEKGSVWNTMPCHTHERRMEVYIYFDMAEKDVVFHYSGAPNETRHIVVRNREAVISPSWSIHSGVGSKNYTFIWGMCGENQAFDDMDFVDMQELK